MLSFMSIATYADIADELNEQCELEELIGVHGKCESAPEDPTVPCSVYGDGWACTCPSMGGDETWCEWHWLASK